MDDFDKRLDDMFMMDYAAEPEPAGPEAIPGVGEQPMQFGAPAAAAQPKPQAEASMTAYDPTTRQKIASFLQGGFESLGMDRYQARRNAQTIIGGASSGAPLGMGVADIVPFLGTALQTEEAVRAGEESAAAFARGDYGTGAMKAGEAVIGMVPGVAGTVKYGQPILREAGKQLDRAMMEGTGPLAAVVPDAVRPMNIVEPGQAMPPATVAEGVVSTRFPTAKKATENPLEQNLVIGLESAKADPAAFEHNVGMLKQYPNFVSKADTPDAQAEDFITHVKDNLLFLHDSVPEATRVRSKLWYDGARNIATRYASEYNIPDNGVAGIMAVLSPQKDWFMNVSLGTRVLDILTKQQTHVWDAGMTKTAKRIWDKPQYAPMVKALQGKSLSDIQDPGLRAMWLRTFDEAYLPREHQVISPEGDFVGVRTTQKGVPMKTGWGSLNEIGKAVAIFDNPNINNVSLNLGTQHKVRNFYNNIFAPNDPGGHVTIDTHAVAAGLLRPLSGNSREVKHNFGSNVKGEVGPANSSVTGAQGTYGLFAEAYRRAAAERGILPREMQSITWEAVRGLFPDTYKTAKNAAQIDGIWLKYKQGGVSLEEARNEVTTAAGGINPPEWERAGLRRESAQAVQPASDKGQLSGAGVPGRGAGRSRRVKPAGGNQANVNTEQGGAK